MPDPQVIIKLDSVGNIQCEAPGVGGAARTKIEGITLDQIRSALPEVYSALIAQRDRIQAQAKASTLAPKAESRNLWDARMESASRAGAERLRRHMAWIESLPREQADYEREKLAKIQERQRASELARAREIYQQTAARHSIELANHVIPDPKRRPRNARPSAKALKSATRDGRVDLTKLREGVDYKVFSW